jgi:hypothetical protein
MNVLMSGQIGDCENPQIFPSEENYVVFSITQSHHSIPHIESRILTETEILTSQYWS